MTDLWRPRRSARPYETEPWRHPDRSLLLARTTVSLIILALMTPVLTVSILALVLLDLPLSADLPDELPTLESRITRIYDSNGVEIAVFRRFETALPLTQEQVPAILEQAVVAAEDRRFYNHRGVDSRGLIRALREDASAGEYEQGGSTITQQLIRLAYTDDDSNTLDRKLREAVLARELESRLSKDEILFRYLSRIYLGGGNYGAAAAAESYFHKPVTELDVSEAALLAGLIPAPSVLDPLSNPVGAEAGRKRVLQAMDEEGMLEPGELDQALTRSVTVVTEEGDEPSRPATVVYRPQEPVVRYPYFADYVRRYLIARYGEELVYTGGLQVETSIDPEVQSLAEASVSKTLQGTPEGIEMSLVSIDPSTGLVRALVGGRDFADSNVNLALGDCSSVEPVEGSVCVAGGGGGRQPGSAFKPVTLAAALDAGFDTSDRYSGPGTFTYPDCTGAGCTVANTNSGSYGSLTLAQATVNSVNTVFAQLILDVGVQETAEMANRLGLTMIDPEGNLPSGEPYGPSLTLGAAEVSPLDMASAFGVFAARGRRFPASPVVTVTGPDGTVLEDNSDRFGERVLSPSVADEINRVLGNVIDSGTGTGADIGREGGMAGKTGTSEAFADAWFVGYTPELSTSVWMGYADSRKALENIKGVARVFGGTLPAATWKDFMAAALTDAPDSTFPGVERVRPANSPESTESPSSDPPTVGGTKPTSTTVPTSPLGTSPLATPPLGTSAVGPQALGPGSSPIEITADGDTPPAPAVGLGPAPAP